MLMLAITYKLKKNNFKIYNIVVLVENKRLVYENSKLHGF